MSNINDTFFDGQYKEIWKDIIPDELTAKEIDFLMSFFNLTEENRVLDLMCGYGRHAIGLARKNIQVTAVDNLPEYIDQIETISREQSLPVVAVIANATEFRTDLQYDLVLCMGNSFNFYDKKNASVLIKNISRLLKPGGRFVLNTWSLTEIAIKTFTAKTWGYVGDLKLLTASEFLFFPTRIEFTTMMIDANGIIEEKKGIDYIYSMAEVESMMSESGLILKEAYSIPGKKSFKLGDPRAYLIAEKS